MTWIYPTILLCLYGFFKEMKPSEPFLTPYLTEPPKNFTEKQLESEVYPFWTYTYLVALFVVFFVTDYFRYKPLIILEALAYLGTRILLIWGTSLVSMQLMQLTYGVATATEIAYYSYIYAAVATQYYQKVTSFTRAAILLGRMTSGILGQLLISLNVTGYLQLNYISFASVILSLLLAFVLPPVPSLAVAFSTGIQNYETTSKFKQFILAWKAHFIDFAQGFMHCYKKRLLLRWSLWWAIATCGEYMVENYVQNLWDTIRSPYHHHIYNGGVTAISHFLASLVAFLLAFVKINWIIWGELCLALFSVVDCFLLLIMAGTKNVWLAYFCYIIFRVIYTFLITIASLQIAKMTDMNRFGLVFGCNMFTSLVLQTILTAVVADKHVLGLDAKDQISPSPSSPISEDKMKSQFCVNSPQWKPVFKQPGDRECATWYMIMHLEMNNIDEESSYDAVTKFVVYGWYFCIIGGVFLAISVYSMTKIGWRTCWRLRYILPVAEDQPAVSTDSTNTNTVDAPEETDSLVV